MLSSKNPSTKNFQQGKTSLSISSRLLASIILGAFFFNTGVLPVRLVILTNADELPADFEFKAPQTVNVPTEETKDFNGYDNELRQEIHEDKSTLNERGTSEAWPIKRNDSGVLGQASSELQPGVPTIIDTTIPVAISNLMKEYQQRILASNFLNQASNFLKALYTTNPNTSGAMALLFNNENYLRLRKEAEDKKKKSLENSLKNKNKRLAFLKDFYLKTLKSIKDQFNQKINRWQSQKNSLKTRLNQVKSSLKNVQQKLNNTPNLKNRLRTALANFNYLRRKEDEHRRAYASERKQYKHDQKKYKKYKKKYKKKHKSKYKHRYKKYKKKYKKHKRRAETQQKRYRDYEKQKNQAWQEYQAILAELNREKDYQNQLSTLNQEEGAIQTNLVVLNNNKPTDNTIQAVNQAKEDYARGIVNTKKLYQEKEIETENIFQTDLERAEVYRGEIASFFANSPLFFLTKSEQDEILKDMQEKIVDGRAQAQERIETRYQATRQTAQTVFLGLLSTPSKLLQAIKGKISTASKYLSKIRKKADKLEDIYKETKAYKKKVKKYKKKYEKYSKKAKKAHGKKRRKYENKKSSAKKKYAKYLKKYNKYYGLKKAYKSGAKQADKIKDAYQDQYDYLLNLQKQLQTNYNDSLSYASKVKNQILTRGENEKKESLEQLKLISPWDYGLIASSNNEDLEQYLSLVSDDTTALNNINNLDIDFSAGLNSLKSLDKSFGKLKHKAKKAYKKAVKKEQERMAKARQQQLAAQRTARANWQAAQLKRQREIERQVTLQRDNTHYDQWGNGYSSRYNTYYSDKATTKSSWFAYSQPVKPKFSWKSLFGATAYASTIKSSYKPKKSWLDKIKGIGQGFLGGAKDAWRDAKTVFGSTWQTIKQGSRNAWNGLINTGKAFGNGIATGVKAIGRTLGEMWNGGINIIKSTGKLLGDMWEEGTSTIGSFAVGSLAWYNKKREENKELSDKIWKEIQNEQDKDSQKREEYYMNIVRDAKNKKEKKRLRREQARQLLPQEAWDYADLADNSYLGQSGNETNSGGESQIRTDIPEGFERFTDLERYGLRQDELEDSDSGLRVSLYINKKTGDLIVVFAGTDASGWQDIKTDGGQGLGMKTKQYEKVKVLADKLGTVVKDRNIIAVGHSLGGGEAAYFGAITKCETITFNAAGVHDNTLERAGITDREFSNITNYVTNEDPLTDIQQGFWGPIEKASSVLPTSTIGGIVLGAGIKIIAPNALGEQVKHDGRYLETEDTFLDGENHSNYHAQY